MGLYVAVIADIINSRNTVDIPEISGVLSSLNTQAGEGLAIPFKCMRGDEIEVVLRLDADVLKTIRQLKYGLRPAKIRVGLGIGKLDADDKKMPDDPFMANGPAFFAARKAVDYAKSRFKSQQAIVVNSQLLSEDLHETWNLMLKFHCSITAQWKNPQWNTAMEYDNTRSMVKTAEQLNKAYQSVQRTIKRSDLNLVYDIEEWFSKQLKSLGKQR